MFLIHSYQTSNIFVCLISYTDQNSPSHKRRPGYYSSKVSVANPHVVNKVSVANPHVVNVQPSQHYQSHYLVPPSPSLPINNNESNKILTSDALMGRYGTNPMYPTGPVSFNVASSPSTNASTSVNESNFVSESSINVVNLASTTKKNSKKSLERSPSSYSDDIDIK